MQLLLVKCDSNWADEFDLKGFAIYVDAAWKEYLKLVDKQIFYKERDEGDECGPHVATIGTNQPMGYSDFKSFKESFKTKKITDEEAKWLCSTFKVKITKKAKDVPVAYGMFMYLDPDYEENNGMLDHGDDTDDDDDVYIDDE